MLTTLQELGSVVDGLLTEVERASA